MELEADGVGSEGAARQAGPLDRALAFFDVLLAGAGNAGLLWVPDGNVTPLCQNERAIIFRKQVHIVA